MLHPAGLSFVNNLMIPIKSLRILDLGLPYWCIVTEKENISILSWWLRRAIYSTPWKEEVCAKARESDRTPFQVRPVLGIPFTPKFRNFGLFCMYYSCVICHDKYVASY